MGTFKQKQLFYAYFVELNCLCPVKEPSCKFWSARKALNVPERKARSVIASSLMQLLCFWVLQAKKFC